MSLTPLFARHARVLLDMLPDAFARMPTIEQANSMERALLKTRLRLRNVEAAQALVAELDQAIATLEVVKLMCDPVPRRACCEAAAINGSSNPLTACACCASACPSGCGHGRTRGTANA